MVHGSEVELVVGAIHKAGAVRRESHGVTTRGCQCLAGGQRKRKPYDRSWRWLAMHYAPNRALCANIGETLRPLKLV